MGAVSIDIHKKERDFRLLTLADENVVKYLILFRSKVDFSYGANMNINIYQAGDFFEFNTELMCLYTSLDNTVKECNFKKKSIKLLDLLYEGNSLQDICKMNIGYVRSATYELFDRIIKKIVFVNNELWKNSMIGQGYIMKDET